MIFFEGINNLKKFLIDMVSIYHHFCKDLQRYVREFIPIYERFGINKKITKMFCNPSNKDRYYKNIRVCPRGWKKGTRFFYYRRAKSNFEWIIRPENNGLWIIHVFGQYNNHKHDEGVYKILSQSICYRYKIDINDFAFTTTWCELVITHDSQLSMQGMLDKLASVIALHISPEVENLHRIMKSICTS